MTNIGTSALDRQTLADFPIEIIGQVETPCYLVSEDVLQRNCELLDRVQQRTGASSQRR